MVLRHAYVSGVPDDIAPPQTSSYVFDTIVRYLRWGIRIVFIVALLVALGVWVSGPATQAVAVRRWVSSETRRLGGRLPAGPVSIFVARYINPLRTGVVGVGGIILLLTEPSVGAIILLAVVVILLLLALEVLRAPVGRAPAK
jgi:high-affinity Fe2+/Pb2+ permease